MREDRATEQIPVDHTGFQSLAGTTVPYAPALDEMHMNGSDDAPWPEESTVPAGERAVAAHSGMSFGLAHIESEERLDDIEVAQVLGQSFGIEDEAIGAAAPASHNDAKTTREDGMMAMQRERHPNSGEIGFPDDAARWRRTPPSACSRRRRRSSTRAAGSCRACEASR